MLCRGIVGMDGAAGAGLDDQLLLHQQPAALGGTSRFNQHHRDSIASVTSVGNEEETEDRLLLLFDETLLFLFN
jgi:hypothetical protein